MFAFEGSGFMTPLFCYELRFYPLLALFMFPPHKQACHLHSPFVAIIIDIIDILGINL